MLAPAAESEAARGALQQQMAALPWHQLSCHLRDETVVPSLLQMLPRWPGTVQLIFSRLDWLAYLTQLVAASGGLPRPQLAPLLQLLTELNAAAPDCISANLRLAAFGEIAIASPPSPPSPPSPLSSQLSQLHAQLWALAEGPSLAAAFDGRALLAPLLRGQVRYLVVITPSPSHDQLIFNPRRGVPGYHPYQVREEPSARLVENAALLYTAASRTGHPAAIAAAVRRVGYLVITPPPSPPR